MNLVLRLSILLLIIIIIELYFFRKGISTIGSVFPKFNPRKIKLTAIVIAAIFNLYAFIGIGFLLYYAVSGVRPSFPPDNVLFDLFVQFPFWIFVSYVVQIVVLFLTIDIIRIILFPLYKSKRSIIKKWIYKTQFILLAAFAIYVPSRIAFDYFAVSTRIVEFKKENLPAQLEDFKIVFISDVQADKYTNPARLERFIDKVNEANPDLVLVAGDIITSTPKYINQSAEYLGKIKSNYGVYSCIGDHDNWAYREDTKRSLREIASALQLYNIEMIDNDKKLIIIDSAKIGITFVTNTYVEKINNDLLDSLTNGKLQTDLKILLTHQPRQFLIDAAKDKNYDLFLAGHTHGGQLTFFFPFYNLSPTLFETKYVRGDFEFENMLAIVTRGLGMSLVPLRYNSTPEVTVIVLRRK